MCSSNPVRIPRLCQLPVKSLGIMRVFTGRQPFMSTFAIVLSLVLLMFLAYRGYTVLLLAPIMAALAVILSGDVSQMLPIYTETFMRALGNVAAGVFPDLPAGRAVWPVDGGFGRGDLDCALDRAHAGQQARDSDRGAGLRHPDLWRRVVVRGGVCDLPDCQVAVP